MPRGCLLHRHYGNSDFSETGGLIAFKPARDAVAPELLGRLFSHGRQGRLDLGLTLIQDLLKPTVVAQVVD